MAADVVNTMADNNYNSAIGKAVERALVSAGMIIEGAAIPLVPVKTGRLRGSITYATRKGKSRVRGKAMPSDAVSTPTSNDEVYIGTNVEYAEAVEYGRKSGMGKQAFLRPAFDANRTEVMRMLAKEVHKGLKDGK